MDGSKPVVFQVGLMGDSYWDWVHRPEPGQPRFFSSTLIEGVSKTPWWVVPLLWVPIFTAAAAHSCIALGVAAIQLFTLLMAGVIAWQLLEYMIHRFVFHADLRSYWGITFHFLFHGCHHKYPMDRDRLVFPPLPASMLVATVYLVLHALLPPRHALPLFAGMGYGYVVYDCMHFTIHHCSRAMRGPLLGNLKRRHLDHHYRNHDTDYGISSVMFDVLFCTRSRNKRSHSA
jgi:dihydroceramide fatty acyl 2-hydroxylase